MRTRDLRPAFFKNEELSEVGALTRLLFAGLWTIADRDGKLEDRPKKIKAEVLPYDDCNVDLMLNELFQMGFIKRYQVDGKAYIKITNFNKHQKVHPKEPASLIPDEAVTFHGQAVECREEEIPNIPLPSFPSFPSMPSLSSSSPTPPSQNLEDEDADVSEKKPVALNGGFYFQIDNRGDQLDEEEWLYRCFLERRRNKNMSSTGCDSLQSLLTLYPNHFEQYRRWVTLPLSVRMTAFALTYLKAAPDDPLKYACWIVENRQKVPDWNQFLTITLQALEQNDLKVCINA